jgi:hypothetical protein
MTDRLMERVAELSGQQCVPEYSPWAPRVDASRHRVRPMRRRLHVGVEGRATFAASAAPKIGERGCVRNVVPGGRLTSPPTCRAEDAQEPSARRLPSRRRVTAVERLLELGATHADIGQGDESWIVLSDREGFAT